MEANGIAALVQTVIDNSTLTTLDLNDNENINSSHADTLSQLIRCNTTLTFLYLSKNSLTIEGLSILCEALIENRSLKTLQVDIRLKSQAYSLFSKHTINRLAFV